MPRPAKAASQRQENGIRMRVAAAEAAAMDACAREAGTTFSAYARDRLIRGTVEQRRSRMLPILLAMELRNIAVNLKQLLALPDDGGIHPQTGTLFARLQAIVDAEIDKHFALEGEVRDWDRDRVRSVRLTAAQREVIDALAAHAGKSVSDYAREMLVEGRVIAWDKEEAVFPRYAALHAAGQELNDKTHAANARGATGAAAAAVIEEIAALVDEVPAV